MLSFLKRKSKREELAPIISNFLFHSSEDPKEEQKEYVELKIKIREYLGNSYFKRILADILLDLQKDVSGGTRQRLYRLYTQLGLHHSAYQKLSSWRWTTVSKGILELSQMEVVDAFQLILKFINDRRGVVRKQAEIAIVLLRHDGIEHLLDTTKYAISEWQQLKLIEALGSLKNYRPPKFKAWLISHNNDVVLFALRLIKHYNQNEAAPSIAELVKHKNDEIKIAAISCIKDFNFIEALSLLKKIYWNCSSFVKIQLLDTIGHIGGKDNLPFLLEVEQKETDFPVKCKALAAMNSISPDTVLPTNDIVGDLEVFVAYPSQTNEDKPSEKTTDSIDKERPIADEKELEIDEVEVFDLLDTETNDQDKVETFTVKYDVEEPQELDFEIKPADDELNASLNDSLSLLGSDDIETLDANEKGITDDYGQMSAEDKNMLIDSLETGGDERETKLLEFIIEHEDESELRFRAFNVMKSLGKNEDDEKVMALETSKETYGSALALEEPEEIEVTQEFNETKDLAIKQSIFHELYHYATDINAKEILVGEIIEVGDERDIPFLEQLLETAPNRIKKIAQKAIVQIEKRRPEGQNREEDPIPLDTQTVDEAVENLVQSDHDLEKNGELPAIEMPIDEDDGKIPLELCFLYDELGILYDQEKEDLGLNFELADEFFRTIISENLNDQER